MRLIDADALEKELNNERERFVALDMKGAEHILVHSALRLLRETPTIDAMPVVRCEDCRWWNDGTQMCGITISATPYGHCHDGEREDK